MIRPPRRSVTRFFIPLIDVLTLLFCIFLLMPMVRFSGDGAGAETPAAREQRLRLLEEEVETLRKQASESPDARKRLERMNQELEELRKLKLEALQDRLAIRPLEIDPVTGKLYYYNPERVEIRNQADAHDLIARDRRVGRELYYLILYPRDPNSPRPFGEQREMYDRWFADVAHGWDTPGRSARGGTP